MLPGSLPAVSCRGSWPLGEPQYMGPGFTSLPAPPQFNASSFPQCKSKFHNVRGNHRITGFCFYCARAMPGPGKLPVPYPASAQVANPTKHTVSWCSLPLEGWSSGPRPALSHHPITPWHFMLCHCLQRSVLRPYHSFLALILSELKCCI